MALLLDPGALVQLALTSKAIQNGVKQFIVKVPDGARLGRVSIDRSAFTGPESQTVDVLVSFELSFDGGKSWIDPGRHFGTSSGVATYPTGETLLETSGPIVLDGPIVTGRQVRVTVTFNAPVVTGVAMTFC